MSVHSPGRLERLPQSSGTELDPDPVTILLVTLAVYSALISTLDLVLRYLDRIADAYSRPVTQALISLKGDLKRVESQTRVLKAFLRRHEISLESRMNPGFVGPELSPEEFELYSRLVRDTLDVVRDVHDHGMVLAALLSNKADVGHGSSATVRCKLANDLEAALSAFNEARYASSYAEFLKGTRRSSLALNRVFRKMQKTLWDQRR